MSIADQKTKKKERGTPLSSIQPLTRRSSPRPWRSIGMEAVKADSEDIYSRQPPDSDYFSGLYGRGLVIQPAYNPFNMYIIYEKSDVLRWCVAAMKLNVVGFGHSLIFVGQDRVAGTEDDVSNERSSLKDTPKDDPEAIAQKEKTESFLEMVNEDGQSFKTICLLCWEDYEVVGNAAMEVVKNAINEIESIYHLPIKFVRKTVKPDVPIYVDVTFIRNGKPIKLRRRRYFRTFIQQPTRKASPIYYKEYGDPRVLNSLTGEFVTDSAGQYVIDIDRARSIMQGKAFEPASEVLWLQQNMGDEAYGVPRWVGGMFNILGRHSASVINYKLTTKGGIPPFIITVNGGTLTTESMKDLKTALQTWQTEGTDTWIRGVVLESTPESTGLDDKGTAQINIRWMTDGRREDVLFGNYGKDAETNVRKCFRFAPLYTGGTEDYNRAVAITAMRVTEQQAFQPERELFDEVINAKLLREGLGITLWKYKSNGPRIVGDDEFRMGFQAFAQYGAITLNDSIDMANAAFGLEMSKYTQKWGDFPFALLVELVRQGKLAELDDIVIETPEPVVDTTGILPQPTDNPTNSNSPTPTGGSQGGVGLQTNRVMPEPPIPSTSKMDALVDEVLDPEIFSEEERLLYKNLLSVRDAIAKVQLAHEITDHEIKL